MLLCKKIYVYTVISMMYFSLMGCSGADGKANNILPSEDDPIHDTDQSQEDEPPRDESSDDEETSSDTDSDADADGDSDTDSDADADGDSDTDSDADGDSDTDSDADADSDGDTDADGGTEVDTDTSDFETCTKSKATAEKEQGKSNLVIAVDTSGSMTEETAMVQENINNRFAQKFGANPNINVRIVLIAEPASDPGDDGMCVSTPLGSGNCPNDSNPPELFWHIPEKVGSHDALEKFIDCWSGNDCAGEKWQDYASADGFVHFVVVSDDDSSVEASEFSAWADGLFGDAWMFHGIVSKTDDRGDGATPECKEYSANEGTVYKELITQTGGVFGDLCIQKNNEFDAVFDEITTAVITHVIMPCEWTIPEPPDEEELDPAKVNVVFEDLPTILDIGKVSTDADCGGVEHGWYYDDDSQPTKIFVCPQTCDWIQGRPDAELKINFGCKTEEAVVI